MERQEELRRIAQLLEVDSEIVLRIGIELPEMRATLERLAMPSRQNFIGERRHRLRQDGQRFAVDLVAPAAAFYQMPQREQETAATGTGENGLQSATLAKIQRPLPLDPYNPHNFTEQPTTHRHLAARHY